MMLSDLGSSLQMVPAYVYSALKQYSTKLMSSSDLNVVKQSLLNKWRQSRVGNEALGNQATEAISHGDVEDVWRRERHLMSITPEDIRRVCKYTFQNQRSVTGLLFKPQEEAIPRPCSLRTITAKACFKHHPQIYRCIKFCQSCHHSLLIIIIVRRISLIKQT